MSFILVPAVEINGPEELEKYISLDKPRYSHSNFFSSICFNFPQKCQSTAIYLKFADSFLTFMTFVHNIGARILICQRWQKLDQCRNKSIAQLMVLGK